MTPKPEIKAFARSQWLFARLLAIYPRNHRQEYGPAMAQLFRDQCRDVWRQSGSRGMVRLWLRVLPDLFKTAFCERLTALGEKMSMLKQRLGLTSDSPRSHVFLRVFAMTFAAMLIVCAVATFCIVPELYSARARIKVEQVTPGGLPAPGESLVAGDYDPFFLQTEFDVLLSDAVLDRVMANLASNEPWDGKLRAAAPVRYSHRHDKLRSMIELRPVRNTSLVDITAYSRDPAEAARIANAFATACKDFHHAKWGLPGAPVITDARVEVIDTALPGLRPVRPNVWLNMAAGSFMSLLLALASGLVGALLFGRSARHPPAVA